MNKNFVLELFRILLLLLSFCSCKSNLDQEEPILETRKGLQSQGLVYQNQVREYLLYIPESYNESVSMPVMLNFHGFGGTAERHLRNADMRSLSESKGFIKLIKPPCI